MRFAAAGKRLRSTFHGVRLRTQLLLVVNLAIAAVLAGFVVSDYRRAVTSRLRDKEIALAEEGANDRDSSAIAPCGGPGARQEVHRRDLRDYERPRVSRAHDRGHARQYQAPCGSDVARARSRIGVDPARLG